MSVEKKSPEVAIKDATDRFWASLERRGEDECWPWLGALKGDGYARLRVGNRKVYVHRFAYEILVGPIPDGLSIDHVRSRGCVMPSCCNPDHLEPIALRENILRGSGPPAQNARKTHCKHGHEFDSRNTIIDGRGNRACRECQQIRNRSRPSTCR